MPRAGKYRHRITIEQVSETRSSTGSVTETWSTFAERWAELEGVAGSERFAAEREHAEVTHQFTIRHLDGVTAKMRISYDSRLFDVQSRFDPTGKSEELVILTKEQVN